MKKLYFSVNIILLFMLFQSPVQSQENRILSYAPMGFANKVRVKVEFPYKTEFSYGTFLNLYYANFKGFCIEPFARYYLSEASPCGAYLQAKLSAGYFSSNIEYNNGFAEEDPQYKTFKETADFVGLGLGFAFGYQFQNRKMRYWDFFGGYKYMPFLGPEFKSKDNAVYYSDSDFYWLSSGPGSMFNFHFGIGYSF